MVPCRPVDERDRHIRNRTVELDGLRGLAIGLVPALHSRCLIGFSRRRDLMDCAWVCRRLADTRARVHELGPQPTGIVCGECLFSCVLGACVYPNSPMPCRWLWHLCTVSDSCLLQAELAPHRHCPLPTNPSANGPYAERPSWSVSFTGSSSAARTRLAVRSQLNSAARRSPRSIMIERRSGFDTVRRAPAPDCRRSVDRPATLRLRRSLV